MQFMGVEINVEAQNIPIEIIKLCQITYKKYDKCQVLINNRNCNWLIVKVFPM